MYDENNDKCRLQGWVCSETEIKAKRAKERSRTSDSSSNVHRSKGHLAGIGCRVSATCAASHYPCGSWAGLRVYSPARGSSVPLCPVHASSGDAALGREPCQSPLCYHIRAQCRRFHAHGSADACGARSCGQSSAGLGIRGTQTDDCCVT